jgi:hypothetical protein
MIDLRPAIPPCDDTVMDMNAGQHRKGGCLIHVGVAVAGIGLLVACGIGNKNPGPASTTVMPHPTNAANIKNICDFFYTRAIETLQTDNAHGNATTLAARAGVPRDIRNAVESFYGTTDTKAGYATVITTCEKEGWKP